MSNTSTPICIFWFRRDLRFHDNHGLHRALLASNNVLPVFVFDKNILGDINNIHDRRVSFLHDTLRSMNTYLETLGKSLMVVYDTPVQAFERLCSQFTVTDVYTNHDYEPYAIARDKEIATMLQKRGVGFHSYKDHVVFEGSEITKADGKPYTIYTPYSKAWRSKLHQTGLSHFDSEGCLSHLHSMKVQPLPSLEYMGFTPSAYHVASVHPDKDIVRRYHEQRNFPGIEGTTEIGVHLRFGTVSVRDMVRRGLNENDTWLSELIWREFFSMILSQFPYVVTRSFKPDYDDIEWRNNDEEFAAWCEGRTGYTMVDAGMRQLVATGTMHNRVRMVVASFLCKDLLVDWRRGEAFFARHLMDYDLSSNNGNWQWAAGCGCDAAPYFRVFNPHEQQRKFDPDYVYTRKWLSDDEISFPTPIVDHAFARIRALQVYKDGLGRNASY